MFKLGIYDLMGNPIEDLGIKSLEEIRELAEENYVGEGKTFEDQEALDEVLAVLDEHGGDSWLIGGGKELRIVKVEEPEEE